MSILPFTPFCVQVTILKDKLALWKMHWSHSTIEERSTLRFTVSFVVYLLFQIISETKPYNIWNYSIQDSLSPQRSWSLKKKKKIEKWFVNFSDKN